MTKILITGSRSITDKELVFKELNMLIKESDVIIHGGAPGIDTIAKEWCEKNNVKNIPIRPAKTLPIYYLHRNAEMIGMCDEVIAFWDGKSRGTKFTMDYARLRKRIIYQTVKN